MFEFLKGKKKLNPLTQAEVAAQIVLIDRAACQQKICVLIHGIIRPAFLRSLNHYRGRPLQERMIIYNDMFRGSTREDRQRYLAQLYAVQDEFRGWSLYLTSKLDRGGRGYVFFVGSPGDIAYVRREYREYPALAADDLLTATQFNFAAGTGVQL